MTNPHKLLSMTAAQLRERVRELERENAKLREGRSALRKRVELLTMERDGARAERNHYMAETRRMSLGCYATT